MTVSQQEISLAIIAAVSMREEGGWPQRAHYLAGKALETMRSMHRTRGVGYGNLDVHAYAIRGESSQMIAALRQAIDDGWRMNWWDHRLRHYQVLVQERPSTAGAAIGVGRTHSRAGSRHCCTTAVVSGPQGRPTVLMQEFNDRFWPEAARHPG